MPITPCSDASVSPMLTPTRTGTRPGSPVRWRSPPIASATAPKSASVFAANGPAISWPSSTTFSPASGPAAVLVDGAGAGMVAMVVRPARRPQARRSDRVLLQQVARAVVLAQHLGQVRQHLE